MSARPSSKDGKGVMTDYIYVDGAEVLPSDDEVKKLRPAATDERRRTRTLDRTRKRDRLPPSRTRTSVRRG